MVPRRCKPPLAPVAGGIQTNTLTNPRLLVGAVKVHGVHDIKVGLV